MDPLTLALISAGATAVGGLPDIIPNKLEREQKKRLQELKRREELGTLGLSQTERDLIAAQYGGAQEQADERQRALMGQYGALQGQPATAALGMAEAGQQAKELAAAQAQQVAMADLQRKAQQEQEILDLTTAQTEMARQRREALVAPVSAGAETYVKGQTLKTLAGSTGTGEPFTVEDQTVANYMAQYGLNETEARKLYQDFDQRDMDYLGLL
jgi:hypothetical protein